MKQVCKDLKWMNKGKFFLQVMSALLSSKLTNTQVQLPLIDNISFWCLSFPKLGKLIESPHVDCLINGDSFQEWVNPAHILYRYFPQSLVKIPQSISICHANNHSADNERVIVTRAFVGSIHFKAHSLRKNLIIPFGKSSICCISLRFNLRGLMLTNKLRWLISTILWPYLSYEKIWLLYSLLSLPSVINCISSRSYEPLVHLEKVKLWEEITYN